MKTSGVAAATNAEPVVTSACAVVTAATKEGKDDVPEPPTIRWKIKENSEVRPVMWQLHHRMPAWKLKVCIDALQVRPVDLTALAEVTGVQFASAELVEVAAKCLDEIMKEREKDETSASGATTAAPSSDIEQKEGYVRSPKGEIWNFGEPCGKDESVWSVCRYMYRSTRGAVSRYRVKARGGM